MSTETLAQALTAGQVARFGAGTNFLILSAAGPVSITAIQLGNSNKRIVLQGALQGFTYKGAQDGGFDLLEVTSATNQPGFVIVVGDDDVSYPSTVQVAGQVSTEVVPAAAVTDIAPVVTVAGAQTALFPANAARRRITVFFDPTNAANQVIYLRAHGAAHNLGLLTPGGYLDFEGTYGVDYFCTSAGDSLLIFEES